MSGREPIVTNDPAHLVLSPPRKKTKRNTNTARHSCGPLKPVSQPAIPRFPVALAPVPRRAVPSYEDLGVDDAADSFLDPPFVQVPNWFEYYQGLATHKLYWEIDLDNTDKGQACFALANYALSPDGRYQGLKVGPHSLLIHDLS